MDTLAINKETSEAISIHIQSYSQTERDIIEDLNKIIAGSSNPFPLNELNRKLTEYGLSEEQLFKVINGLNTEPTVKEGIKAKQLRLRKIEKSRQKFSDLCKSRKWSVNRKRYLEQSHSEIENKRGKAVSDQEKEPQR